MCEHFSALCVFEWKHNYVFINRNEHTVVSVCHVQLLYLLVTDCSVVAVDFFSLCVCIRVCVCLLPLQESPVHWGGALNPGSPRFQNGGVPPPACNCNPAGPRRCLPSGLCLAVGTRASPCCTWFLPSAKKHAGISYMLANSPVNALYVVRFDGKGLIINNMVVISIKVTILFQYPIQNNVMSVLWSI